MITGPKEKYIGEIKLKFAWWPTYVGGCYGRRHENDLFIWFQYYLTVSGPTIPFGRYYLLNNE